MTVSATRPLTDAAWLARDDADELRAAVGVLRRRAADTWVLRFIIAALLGAAKRIESQI